VFLWIEPSDPPLWPEIGGQLLVGYLYRYSLGTETLENLAEPSRIDCAVPICALLEDETNFLTGMKRDQ